MDDARTWLPRCLAMAAFVLYVMAAPPGLYWLDAAEASAAAVTLGASPSASFPLYCIVARAATLVPVGELAFRIALLDAACAALAVFFCARLVLELGRGDGHALVGAAVAGALLAVSGALLRQATIAGVHAPGAALLAGGLLLLERVSRGGDARRGLALALVCGLGLAVHAGAWLLGLVVVALMGVRLYRGARWPLAAPVVVLAMAGAAFAYLPVRAATGRAAVLDGAPVRARRLLAALAPPGISGARGPVDASGTADASGELGAVDASGASGAVGGLAGAFGESAAHERPRGTAPARLDGLADHVGPLAPLAALLGLSWLARQRRSRWPAAALIVIALGDLLYALLVSPVERGGHGGVLLAVAVSAGAGVGVAWLSRFLRGAGPFAGAFAGVLLVLPPALVSVPAVWSASAGDGSDAPRAWAEAALAATPPRGVALVAHDATAAGLRYLTEVERARPDLAVIARQRLGDVAHVRAALARAGMDTRDLAGDLDAAGALAWLLAGERDVAWELGGDPVPAGMYARIAAPLAVLAPDGVDRASGRAPDRTTGRDDGRAAVARAAQALDRIFAGASGQDRIARQVRARALAALGRLAHVRGHRDLAAELLERALRARAGE